MTDWSIEAWKPSISKMIKMVQSLDLCQSTNLEIHFKDLEVLLNGLNRYPTRSQLIDLTNQIRFRESHITGEVSETVCTDDFCQIMENWSKWLTHTTAADTIGELY